MTPRSDLPWYGLALCQAYDPAFAYEVAAIVEDGIKRMYTGDVPEDRFYYLTLYNENYPQPPMPSEVEEGIIRGLYRYRSAPSAASDRTQEILRPWEGVRCRSETCSTRRSGSPGGSTGTVTRRRSRSGRTPRWWSRAMRSGWSSRGRSGFTRGSPRS